MLAHHEKSETMKRLIIALLVAGFGSGVHAAGPAPVGLGAAGTFVILSKAGITDVPASAVKGNVGTSPISGSALHLSCGEVTGNIFAVDAAGPPPCAIPVAAALTTAVLDMETAYDDAAGRVTPPATAELGAGEMGGLTLAPGLYKWGTGLLISSDVTLAGSATDVWILQVAGTLTQASATRINLTGGALAKNVFWQVAGAVTIGTTAHFEGIVLAKTLIAMNTGASMNGRLLAQTEVTLQQNTVSLPAGTVVPPIVKPPCVKPPPVRKPPPHKGNQHDDRHDDRRDDRHDDHRDDRRHDQHGRH
jgi:hypothetical protein